MGGIGGFPEDYLTVSLTTSSIVVSPSAIFSSPLVLSVIMPSLVACSRRSIEDAPSRSPRRALFVPGNQCCCTLRSPCLVRPDPEHPINSEPHPDLMFERLDMDLARVAPQSIGED